MSGSASLGGRRGGRGRLVINNRIVPSLQLLHRAVHFFLLFRHGACMYGKQQQVKPLSVTNIFQEQSGMSYKMNCCFRHCFCSVDSSRDAERSYKMNCCFRHCFCSVDSSRDAERVIR